jgi:hypothetical protein
MRGLEQAHRLKRRHLVGGEEERLQARTVAGHLGECPEQRSRGGERHVVLGLVARDSEAVPKLSAALRLGEEAALPTPRLADHDRRRGAAARAGGDLAEGLKLPGPTDEYAHSGPEAYGWGGPGATGPGAGRGPRRVRGMGRPKRGVSPMIRECSQP